MKRALRQLRGLLTTSLRVDLRTRDPLTGRISRSSWSLISSLVFYVLVGGCLTLFMSGQVPPHIQITTYLAVAGIYVGFNILIEYQHILLAPEDSEVLNWRPITPGTLLAARCLHVLVYVSTLSAALLLVPALVLARDASASFGATLVAFIVAALFNTMLATSVTIALYTLILRTIPGRRFKNALAGLQVVLSLILILGFQLVGPVFDRVTPHDLARPPLWLDVLPAAWFAHVPLAVGWPELGASWGPPALGALVVVALAGLAARWIGPRYVERLSAVESSDGLRSSLRVVGDAVVEGPEPRLQRWFAVSIVRHPLRQAGFRFFLANLNGDRRLHAALVQVVALPVLFVLMALLLGDAHDPYATDLKTWTSGRAAAAGGADSSSFTLFAAAYLLAMMVPTTSRLLRSSTSWRAAWVVFASPTRRYDRIYSGILLGITYGLVLPATGLLVAALLLLWRDPIHVVAHLALPTGTALVAFPILLKLDAQVPFSSAPARHDRTRELLRVAATLVPIAAIAYAHSALRAQPVLLIALGVALSVVGASSWSIVARRVRALPHQHAFDG